MWPRIFITLTKFSCEFFVLFNLIEAKQQAQKRSIQSSEINNIFHLKFTHFLGNWTFNQHCWVWVKEKEKFEQQKSICFIKITLAIPKCKLCLKIAITLFTFSLGKSLAFSGIHHLRPLFIIVAYDSHCLSLINRLFQCTYCFVI